MLVGLLGYLLYTATLFVTYDLSLPFMPDKHTSLHLGLFTHSDLRLLIGTIVAAEVSITGGFFARDLWVFTDWSTADTPRWVKFLQYQAKSLVSTLGILTVTVNVLTLEAGFPHYIATPVGVAAGALMVERPCHYYVHTIRAGVLLSQQVTGDLRYRVGREGT